MYVQNSSKCRAICKLHFDLLHEVNTAYSHTVRLQAALAQTKTSLSLLNELA